MGDPATGGFGDARVIGKFGDVPDDLSALGKKQRTLPDRRASAELCGYPFWMGAMFGCITALSKPVAGELRPLK
jgi:hypothetical protein